MNHVHFSLWFWSTCSSVVASTNSWSNFAQCTFLNSTFQKEWMLIFPQCWGREGGKGHHLNQTGRAAAEQGPGQGLQSPCTGFFRQQSLMGLNLIVGMSLFFFFNNKPSKINFINDVVGYDWIKYHTIRLVCLSITHFGLTFITEILDFIRLSFFNGIKLLLCQCISLGCQESQSMSYQNK